MNFKGRSAIKGEGGEEEEEKKKKRRRRRNSRRVYFINLLPEWLTKNGTACNVNFVEFI